MYRVIYDILNSKYSLSLKMHPDHFYPKEKFDEIKVCEMIEPFTKITYLCTKNGFGILWLFNSTEI